MTVLDDLAGLALDWTDLDEAGRKSRDFLARLAAAPDAVGALLEHLARDPALQAMCERHELLDYLVLADEPERGFRLRLHVSTEVHASRPHDHRFSFSTFIVRGRYHHTQRAALTPVYQDDEAPEQLRQWDSKRNPDPRGRCQAEHFPVIAARDETEGCSYTMHHSIVHTTVTTPGTVSLFLRGPAEKDRSLILDESGKAWWRHGSIAESPSRRDAKRMEPEERQRLISEIRRIGLAR